MRTNILILLSSCLLFAACGNQTQEKSEMDFTDDVKVALADSGQVDLGALRWTREPGAYEVNEESSFTAVFSDMKITECMWKAHDGQQPDKE